MGDIKSGGAACAERRLGVGLVVYYLRPTYLLPTYLALPLLMCCCVDTNGLCVPTHSSLLTPPIYHQVTTKFPRRVASSLPAFPFPFPFPPYPLLPSSSPQPSTRSPPRPALHQSSTRPAPLKPEIYIDRQRQIDR